MLGFATVDHQAGASNATVWLTSRTGDYSSGKTNAVCLNLSDPEFAAKVHALTRDRIVVLTNGSAPDGLPIAGWLAVDDLDLLGTETEKHQERICQAVQEARTAGPKKRSLVGPSFILAPRQPDRWGESSVERALATANYVSTVWDWWLAAEEQRCRRLNVDPPILPESLSSPEVAELPDVVYERWPVEKLEPFNA